MRTVPPLHPHGDSRYRFLGLLKEFLGVGRGGRLVHEVTVLFWVELTADLEELALVSPGREDILHHPEALDLGLVEI